MAICDSCTEYVEDEDGMLVGRERDGTIRSFCDEECVDDGEGIYPTLQPLILSSAELQAVKRIRDVLITLPPARSISVAMMAERSMRQRLAEILQSKDS